ncbi:hypothetical protein B0T26DRAFT_496936 [Lasiosphaeria miniovina]|uniref:Uncharacterized protein n=1 Tax=Lasiosphaeria miniovina TaxID=1954250 RepID=A0AA40DH73_9PEZI|nr:uncharacterized protein B0T26DRAFT_496936 [Lasiosphaeria miniovina]KAK0703399.1 hypothetical protein B0T26DRAFT_496936 [Lasiosphaeria miniovina]
MTDLMNQQDGVVAFSAGHLKFDDNSCSDEQKDFIETAAWDALTLSIFAAVPPTSGKEIAVWKTWIGPDYITQQQRILADLQAYKNFDAIMSCKDTKNRCGRTIDGKDVGGYAWTVNGWFWNAYYITLCPVWFGLNSLEDTITFIEAEPQKGQPRYAQEAVWQRSAGQYLLHEIRHLGAVGQPHGVADERVTPGGNEVRAYGPRLVYKLTQGPINQGGGAACASTNADSYAWLANSLYFCDLTGFFPRPPKYREMTAIDSFNVDDEVLGQHVIPLLVDDIFPDTTHAQVMTNLQTALGGITANEPTAALAQPTASPTPTTPLAAYHSTRSRPGTPSSRFAVTRPYGIWLSQHQFRSAQARLVTGVRRALVTGLPILMASI